MLTLRRDQLNPMTYLHYFAKLENERVCKLLLNYGADASIRSGGYREVTPIDVWPELENIVNVPIMRIIQVGNAARGTGTRFCDIEFK